MLLPLWLLTAIASAQEGSDTAPPAGDEEADTAPTPPPDPPAEGDAPPAEGQAPPAEGQAPPPLPPPEGGPVELDTAGDEDFVYEVRADRAEGSTAGLLQERQEASAVTDSIGSEELGRTGDGSAAAGLRRVTGLSVVDGKYVYVRGLGDRYASTLLNGSSLPSPEPERRVVPLDLFPTDVLESVLIQKTASPDMPAEFGGGTVVLRTRHVPTAPVFELGVSGTYVHGSTFREGLWGPSGGTDWLGVDDGGRALPDEVAAASADQPLEEGDLFSDGGYTAEELEALGEAFPSRWATAPRTLPPDLGVDLVAGHGVELGPVRLGGLVGGAYGNAWDRDLYQENFFVLGAGGALEDGSSYDFETVTNTVDLGGIAVLGAELGADHRLTWTTILARSTDNEARRYEGYNRDLDGDIRVTRLRWLERQLLYHQLQGEHHFPFLNLPMADGPTLTWRAAWARADRQEPDRREWRQDYEPGDGLWYLSDRPEGNQMLYSTLDDRSTDLGADLRIPFPFAWSQQGFLKGGAGWLRKDRVVDTRRYKFQHKGERANDDEVLSLPVEEIFTDENIGPDGFQIEEVTLNTDNYLAQQQVHAGFLMAEVPLSPSTRLSGGARLERASQVVETYELFNPDSVPVVATLETNDWLPSATVTQDLPHQMQVRAGYGRTLSRPDLRELSPATYNDVTGGREVYGNPDLQRALIDNVDLRWEWYPDDGGALSVGGFAKLFDQPIEQIVVVSSQHAITYANAERATDLGVELDWRHDFGFLGGVGARLYSAGNVALIHSRVELAPNSGIQTHDDRPLQGQSPYVVNLQVGWDDPDRRTQAALLYNVFGARITEVGALGAPDTRELPVHQLDVVASQGLPHGFEVGIKARNLLDWPRTREQGDRVTETLREGWSLGASLSWGI